ncbi:MAG TPA: preprotein translocase subunit SecG [candidate division WOR-3 bacterium]|uniref:Protein-export membrane protein SecG n=1 Tax=candidate division WOR-3 bacterium TaxID=2052148 RepID=A0A9C9ENT9_UNCW3|nr:preprotein translocase subunit SecG [candidate division WOR-3 bacterium]
MYAVIQILHVIVCVLLIIVVLMQQTRGGGMSSVFGGGGGSDVLFGGKGATPFFVKLTAGLAIGFFITSLTLVLLSRRARPTSAIEKGLQEMPVPVMPEQGAPAIPQQEQPVIPEEPAGGGN